MSVSIRKTGIVQASGDIGENLFRGTLFQPEDIATLATTSSTDWSKYLRYYNTNSSYFTFSGDVLTVVLTTPGNLGISFARLAADIDLDTTSNYTISCEAKCTKSGAHLDIGLSYLQTSNSWVWRGGTGSQNFTAVNTWQKFYRTFKPDADTKAIVYCFTVVGASGGTDTFSLKHCKMEKGSIPTPWCPAPEDEYYVGATSGFNEILYAPASIGKEYMTSSQFYEV